MCVFMGDCAWFASLNMSIFVYTVTACPVCLSGCVLQCQKSLNSVKCTTLAKRNAMQGFSWGSERKNNSDICIVSLGLTLCFQIPCSASTCKVSPLCVIPFPKAGECLMNEYLRSPTCLCEREGSVFTSQCTEMTPQHLYFRSRSRINRTLE